MTYEIPKVYSGPLGMPLYWGNDLSGVLPGAVRAYYDEVLGKGRMEPDKVELVTAYLAHHIEAPCWLESNPGDTANGYAEQILELRERARRLRTVADISAYCADAEELGLSPL